MPVPPDFDEAPLGLPEPPNGEGGPPPFVDPPGGHFQAAPEPRTLPHNADAERECLAAVFVDAGALDTLLALPLTPADFHVPRHRLVYQAMLAVHDSQAQVEFVALREQLKSSKKFEAVGGDATIAALLDRSGTTRNLERYGEIVRQLAMARRVIDAAESIAVDVMANPEDEGLATAAGERLMAALESSQANATRSSREVVLSTIDQIERASQQESEITGLATGFRDFDKKTGGLHGGSLVIIAARPAMGKTSFALNIATHAAVADHRRGVVFSLEMPGEDLMRRQIASIARMDVSKLRQGLVSDDDWSRLTKAADDLSRQDIEWVDRPSITVTEMRAICRRLHRAKPLDFILLDYLQLMGGPRGMKREQQIASISRGLKHLALELKVPVIALSQLNRGPEQRTDKRPMMSDLRESGAIEQDADMVCFLYRDEVYNKAVEESQRGLAELIIGKHRNGPTGTVKLRFFSSFTRFQSLARPDSALGY